jgi:hypothetical protein
LQVNYPNGFDVEVGGEGGDGLEWEWNEENEPFVLYVRKGKEKEGKANNRDVKVTITARA